MRLLYLTQWFDPEPNVIKGPKFIRALRDGGHSVHTVTGFPNYPTGRIYPGYRIRAWQRETIDGVPVTRVPLYPSHSNSSAGRAANFLSFFVSVTLYGLLRGGRYDLAYVYHPPITVGLAAAFFGWVRRLPFVLEIQDLWPDTVVESGMQGTGRLARVLGAMCDFVYRRARMIVVQSEGMRTLLIQRGVPADKVVTIRNWADGAASAVEAAPPADTARLGLLYAGNLGRAQALDAVIRAAATATERGAAIDLTLVGDGVDADALRGLVAEIALPNIRILPRVDKHAAAAMMAAADVLVLHLADQPHFRFTIPSKTQFYLAAGKPVLAGIAGDAADLLRASGAATVVAPEDVEELANAMADLAATPRDALAAMGTAGRRYYEETLSFESGMRATLAVIARAATPPPAARASSPAP